MFNHVDHGFTLEELEADTTENGRFYTTPSGQILPSITTVLSVKNKSGLDAWRKRVGEEEANRVMNQASLRGTAVHQLAEDYVNNEKDWSKGAMPANLFTFNTIKPLCLTSRSTVWIFTEIMALVKFDLTVFCAYFRQICVHTFHIRTVMKICQCHFSLN